MKLKHLILVTFALVILTMSAVNSSDDIASKDMLTQSTDEGIAV